MFRVIFENTAELRNMLSISEMEYIDALFMDDKLMLVANTNEIFVSLQLPVQKSRDQQNFDCRINSKILQSVIDNSVMDVSCTSEMVQLSFSRLDGAKYYSCTFTRQVVLDTAYYDKLKLTSEVHSDVVIDSDQFVDLAKIAKMVNSFVTIDAGAACVMFRNGPRVYKKVTTKQQFALTGSAIMALRKCNSDFLSVHDYVLTASGDLRVLVRKAVLGNNEEYNILMSDRFGAKCIFQMNVGNLLNFFAKTRIKLDSVQIKASDQCVELEAYNSKFQVPIDIKGMQLADGATADDFYVPAVILFSVMNTIGRYEFMVKQKKSFIQLESEDYVIVW